MAKIEKNENEVLGFELNKLDPEIQDLYLNAQIEYREIIETIFDKRDGIISDVKNRPEPPYAKGTLDAPFMQGGMPLQLKSRKLVKAILSGDYSFVEVEGGKRGAKDVNAEFAWAKYLQVCPDRLHLALGSSLEHALRTILMSDGFGLYFLIPHGIFVRESIAGAQRGVYKFLDNYGIEKQILFYGNEKENDKNKFQGFTLGSVYMNESLNQHPAGIREASDRIAAASQPLIITTQNPKGQSHVFYQEIEKPRLATMNNIIRMEYVRDNYAEQFIALRSQLKDDRDREKTKIINDYKSNFSVTEISELPKKHQLKLNQTMLKINYQFDKIIRNYGVEEFAYEYIFNSKDKMADWLNYKGTVAEIQKEYETNKNFDVIGETREVTEKLFSKYKDEYLLGKSMAIIVGFERGGDNPNKVFNSYNFYYAHYNVDDNLSMSEMQRRNYKNERKEGTASHDQDVIGLRRSSEGAIYASFDEENIFSGDIQDFDWSNKIRVIVIDPGFSHPTGMTDWAYDASQGKLWALQERLIDFKIEYQDQKTYDTIYLELLMMIRNAKNRAMPEFIFIDPSKPEFINFLQNYGFSVYPANNENWTTKSTEKETSNEVTARELRGIPLVQVAFARKKIMIHENCPQLIEQVGSYSYVEKEDGKDNLPKLYDDLVVTIKYAVNTLNVVPALWENDSEVGINDENRMEEVQRQKGFSLEAEIRDAFSSPSEEDFYTEDADFFGGEDTDFFN